MINDANMIGYIIGGVVLFFIAVGFVADKTGLIKKTFSKDVSNTKKKEEKVVVPVIPTVEPILEPIENNTMEQETEQTDVVDFEDININNDIPENVELSDSLVSLENFGDVDAENNEVSDITDMEFSEENTDEFMLNDNLNEEVLFDETSDNTDEFMLNENEFEQSDLAEENVDEFEQSDLTEEDEDGFVQIDLSEENQNEAFENDDNDSIVIDSDLDEIVLPELEEIEDNEEDVWKF